MTSTTSSGTRSDATETAWRVHTELGQWTARADAKASFALTLETAAIAGITALSADDRLLGQAHERFTYTLLWLGTALILAAGVFAMLVVVPRLRASKMKLEAPENFIYFGHLMHREADELATALQQADVLPALTRQLIAMSKIAWRKHRYVQLSFILFGTGAALVFLTGTLR